MDVIQASIPLFFALIGLELLVARVRRQRVYRLTDSIADLTLGTLSQLVGIFVALLTVTIYGWIGSRFAIQHFAPVPQWIDRSPFPTAQTGLRLDVLALASWATVFVLDDLTYYWVHRLSHETNLLWAGHVVHHSSEEYNLTVALRQSSLHGLFTWVFYLPLALLGIPVTMWVVCHGLNLIYQFWIHTREIDRLPLPLEAVLNTPSHHRVHHGVNPQYQDRNYAGVFIVWDRLFGTFEPEVEPPVYGITKPLGSWNPVWANLHVFVDIVKNVSRATRWSDKLRLVVGHPGWKPAELGPSEVPKPVSVATFQRFDPPVAGPLKLDAFVQFVSVVVGSVALLEGRSWATLSEVVRLAVLAVAAVILAVEGRAAAPPLLLGAAFAIGSAGWIVTLRKRF